VLNRLFCKSYRNSRSPGHRSPDYSTSNEFWPLVFLKRGRDLQVYLSVWLVPKRLATLVVYLEVWARCQSSLATKPFGTAKEHSTLSISGGHQKKSGDCPTLIRSELETWRLCHRKVRTLGWLEEVWTVVVVFQNCSLAFAILEIHGDGNKECGA
jgi:hypothetical protein